MPLNVVLENLFMVDGKIPQPTWVPKGALWPGNLYEFYSRRLGRRLFTQAFNEFRFFLIVEFLPTVAWFTEHFPKIKLRINEKTVITTFDMLIRFVSGGFLLVEVEPDEEEGAPENLQIIRQQTFADAIGVDYVVVRESDLEKYTFLIDNLKNMVSYLPHKIDARIVDAVIKTVLRHNGATIKDVIKENLNFSEQQTITAIVHGIHSGNIQAPLKTKKFDKTLPLSEGGQSYELKILQQKIVIR